MAKTTGMIITAAVFACTILSASALNCFTCTDCSNTLGTDTTCGNEYIQCAELVLQDLYSTTTQRYCAGQCPNYGSNTVSVKCCTSDLCNTASSQVGSIKSLVGVVAMLVPAFARF